MCPYPIYSWAVELQEANRGFLRSQTTWFPAGIQIPITIQLSPKTGINHFMRSPPKEVSIKHEPKTPIQPFNSPRTTHLENELLKNFTVTHTDFIRQNMSNIYQYYKILHPPLGKGNFMVLEPSRFVFNKIISFGVGAFGEVRKAIHQMSNIPYAIKFIPVKNRDNDD